MELIFTVLFLKLLYIILNNFNINCFYLLLFRWTSMRLADNLAKDPEEAERDCGQEESWEIGEETTDIVFI